MFYVCLMYVGFAISKYVFCKYGEKTGSQMWTSLTRPYRIDQHLCYRGGNSIVHQALKCIPQSIRWVGLLQIKTVQQLICN